MSSAGSASKLGQNFYAQLQVDGKPGWPRPTRTAAEAVEVLNTLKVRRREGALMQVLRYCRDRGKAARLPELKRLKQPKPTRRKLITDEEFQFLPDACRTDVTKNAATMQNFTRFLALTCTREQETARVKREQLDIVRRQVTIGADGLSKNQGLRASVQGSQSGHGQQAVAVQEARERGRAAKAIRRLTTQTHRAAAGASNSLNINVLHRLFGQKISRKHYNTLPANLPPAPRPSSAPVA